MGGEVDRAPRLAAGKHAAGIGAMGRYDSAVVERHVGQKTPAELLRGTEQTAEQRDYTQAVRDSGEALMAMYRALGGTTHRRPQSGQAIVWPTWSSVP